MTSQSKIRNEGVQLSEALSKAADVVLGNDGEISQQQIKGLLIANQQWHEFVGRRADYLEVKEMGQLRLKVKDAALKCLARYVKSGIVEISEVTPPPSDIFTNGQIAIKASERHLKQGEWAFKIARGRESEDAIKILAEVTPVKINKSSLVASGRPLSEYQQGVLQKLGVEIKRGSLGLG